LLRPARTMKPAPRASRPRTAIIGRSLAVRGSDWLVAVAAVLLESVPVPAPEEVELVSVLEVEPVPAEEDEVTGGVVAAGVVAVVSVAVPLSVVELVDEVAGGVAGAVAVVSVGCVV